LEFKGKGGIDEVSLRWWSGSRCRVAVSRVRWWLKALSHKAFRRLPGCGVDLRSV